MGTVTSHACYFFAHNLCESSVQKELESESKVLGFSNKLPVSLRAKLGRIQNNDGGRFRILPAGRLAPAMVHKFTLLIDLEC